MTPHHHTGTEPTAVEEAWIADWAAAGIAALERYLANHAAFEAFCTDHDLDSDHGDGRTRA